MQHNSPYKFSGRNATGSGKLKLQRRLYGAAIESRFQFILPNSGAIAVLRSDRTQANTCWMAARPAPRERCGAVSHQWIDRGIALVHEARPCVSFVPRSSPGAVSHAPLRAFGLGVLLERRASRARMDGTLGFPHGHSPDARLRRHVVHLRDGSHRVHVPDGRAPNRPEHPA